MKTWIRLVMGILGLLIIAVVVAVYNATTGAGVIAALVITGFTEEQSKSFNDFIEKQSIDIQSKVKGLIDTLKDTELIKGIQNILNGEGEKKGLVGNLAEMQKQLDDISTKLVKAEKESGSANIKTFAAELKEKLNAEIKTLQNMATRKGGTLDIELKSFLESANASITTGSLLPTPQFEVGISKAPDRMPYMMDIITVVPAAKETVYWTQRKTRTDNGGFVTEGTTTKVGGGSVVQSVLGYETKNASMQNILAFIKCSNNSIDDIEWLVSEVQTELLTLMALQLDAALLTGTIAVNGFDGVLVNATAFAAGGKTLKAGVVPNNYDALKFAATQIKKAYHKPTHVVLNPDDVLAMELERDDRGGYLWPPYMAVKPSFAGIQIVENTGITSGTYLIGDFSKAKFWIRKGYELKIYDQNEDDAINQLKTITLYMRGVLVVKDADLTAFVTDTFADSIAEITLAGA